MFGSIFAQSECISLYHLHMLFPEPANIEKVS
jgi:hypothetical protein